MPIQIVRNDITKVECDAIVNAANSSLLGGGGVDGAIHRAAGRELLEECRRLGGCETGEAKITGAYKLPCKYVIHTVGPVWRDGRSGEEESLRSCYRNSLGLAVKSGCESVAFPLISAGAYGYPREQALQVAIDEISSFLMRYDMLVYMVIYDRDSFRISQKLEQEIRVYIDERYVEAHYVRRGGFLNIAPMQEKTCETSKPRMPWMKRSRKKVSDEAPESYPDHGEAASKASQISWAKATASQKPQGAGMSQEASQLPQGAGIAQEAAQMSRVFGAAVSPQTEMYFDAALPSGLRDVVSQIDESFSQMLLRKIDEKGMTDAECYKKANIDRKLFSKIRSDIQYRPSKPTAIAFAIALELSPEETKDLLMKAGYALSHSNKFDIIVEFFINRRNYNIFEINGALFAFDQSLLGAG